MNLYNSSILKTFQLTANYLHRIARKTGRTYYEINVFVYFFLIPFSWCWLTDNIFHFHYLKLGFILLTIGFFIGCRNFREYSDELFFKSVKFLNFFNRFGSNYKLSSVIICLLLPFCIYTYLIYLNL